MLRNFFIAVVLFLSLQFSAAAVPDVRIPLYFKLDETSHDPEYISNTESLDSLARLLGRLDPDCIDSIDITAYASPEGVYEHNMKLSRARARHAASLVAGRCPALSGKIRTHAGGEAWGLLRERVAEDKRLTNWWRRRILHFLDDDSISDDTRKWRLSHWLGYEPAVGDMYKWLKREHYTYLRCCFVVVIRQVPLPQLHEVAESASASVDTATIVGTAAPAGTTGTTGTTDTTGTAGTVVTDAPSDPAVVQESSGTEDSPLFPVLGISTNLPYDITYIPGYGLTSIPSFSLEYYPGSGSRWTFGADVEWPMWKHWDTHKFMQINNLTLWTRRYFRTPDDGRYQGTYLLGSANAARYGIGFDEKGRIGEGIGASLGVGRKWVLGRSRFFIDAGLALGLFWSPYDPYVYGNDALGWYYYDYDGKPEDFRERSMRWLWMGPTRAWISIGIDLFNRNRR